MFRFATTPEVGRLSESRRSDGPDPFDWIGHCDSKPNVRTAKIQPRSHHQTFDFTSISDVTCFVADTLIRTPSGEVPIDALSVGDPVMTRDHGAQIIRWIGKSQVDATPHTAPIAFSVGALGNTVPLQVSPQHRVLLTGWRCATIAGTKEVLAPARHLINDRDIKQVIGGKVTYIHLAFDHHEIIMAHGIASESFHPDSMSLDGLNDDVRSTLLDLFPDVGAQPASYGPKVRPEVKPYEARLIRP